MTTLPDLETARHWPNLTMVASDGSPVGQIESIYLDHATGRPEWALVGVEDGGNAARKAFVPLVDANEQVDRVNVPCELAQITGAPVVPAQAQLSRSEETRLYDHYGITYSTAASPSVLPAAEADPSDLDHPLADDELDGVGSEVDTSPGGGVRPKYPSAAATGPAPATGASEQAQRAFATEPLVAAEHTRVVEAPPARGRGRLVGGALTMAGLVAAGLAATRRRRQPPGLTERLGLSQPRRRGLLGGLGRRSKSGMRTEVTRQMRKTKRKVTKAQRRLERATSQLAKAGTKAARTATRGAEERGRRATKAAERTRRRAARQAEATRRRTARAAAGAAGTVAGATSAAARAAAGTAGTAARTAGGAAGTVAGLPAATASAARDRVRTSIPHRQRRSKRMRKTRSRFGLAIGAAIGYVFGTKAGRERYDQIVGAARQFGERPEVKRIVEQAPGAIETTVGQVADKAADKVGQARQKVAPDATAGDRQA
jgi:hypothetical protein